MSNLDQKRSASPVSYPHTTRYVTDTPSLNLQENPSEFELKEVDTISETNSVHKANKAKEEESLLKLMDDFSDFSAIENKRKISDETTEHNKGDLPSSSSPEGTGSRKNDTLFQKPIE